jgi:O-acetyl-ADP-ribose deacetylase (regulator of RNase III)
MEKKVGTGGVIVLAQGDITALATDAIVNAANIHLQHGGGVALAISRKGGPTIQAESDAIIAKRGPLKTGEAVITSGGKLPAQWVIHTVGPVWGEGDEDNKLCRAIRSSLMMAEEKGLKTIALPAVSAGIYHFPLDRCAKLLVETASEYLKGNTKIEKVIFCLFDTKTYKAFEAALTDS